MTPSRLADLALRGVALIEHVGGEGSFRRRLMELGRVRVRQVAEYGYNYMRLSTHVYNGPDQIDNVVALLGRIAAE